MTRELVIDAATRTIRAGDFDQLTIRGLAAELGVAPMTLYRHVRDKDDLLDEVTDRLLAAAWEPRAPRSDWVAWVTEAADRLRRLLVDQPAALHVYLRHPVVSPAAILRMQTMLEVLRGSGAADQDPHRAYATIHTYTIGFATLEASRAGWTPPGDDRDDLAHELAAHTTPQQFSQGLAYLLEGIQQHTGAERSHPVSRRPSTKTANSDNK